MNLFDFSIIFIGKLKGLVFLSILHIHSIFYIYSLQVTCTTIDLPDAFSRVK